MCFIKLGEKLEFVCREVAVKAVHVFSNVDTTCIYLCDYIFCETFCAGICKSSPVEQLDRRHSVPSVGEKRNLAVIILFQLWTRSTSLL